MSSRSTIMSFDACAGSLYASPTPSLGYAMTLHRRLFLTSTALCPDRWAPNPEIKALAERLLQELRDERKALERQQSEHATGAVRVGHEIHPISSRELQLLERTWDWFEEMHPPSVAEAQPTGPSATAAGDADCGAKQRPGG